MGNSDRLLQLINDTIQLSKLDHGETGSTHEEIDLFEAATECCNNLKVNADIEMDSAPGIGTEISVRFPQKA